MARSTPPLDLLREEWDGLAEGFRTPLLETDWFASCAEAFHQPGDLRLLVTRTRGAVTGVAPLVREGAPGQRRLVLLGASKLHEPGGWLYASDEDAADLVDQAVRTRLPMLLHRVPEESPVLRALSAISPHRAVTTVRGRSVALGVPTRGAWNDYYERLSSHIRVNLRRLRRKAERELGGLHVARFAPQPAEVDNLLETVMRVEGSGWKGRNGSSLAVRPDLRRFFRNYCHRASARGRLRIALLAFGSETAAAELSVEAYGRMWQLKIGYNEAVAAYYPGLHLTEDSIRDAFERGLEAYEFLGSAAAWEERWAPEPRTYRTVAMYPLTPGGVLTVCRDLAGFAWRRAQHSMAHATGSAEVS